jgi:hypothetical protein
MATGSSDPRVLLAVLALSASSGCFWVGRGDVAPYPVTSASLRLAEPQALPAAPLGHGWAPPTLRSLAPDPLEIELTGRGLVRELWLGELQVPRELGESFRAAVGGAADGTPVEVVIERLNVVCTRDGLDGVAPGAHLLLGAQVRYGDGPWVAQSIALHGTDGCAPYGELYRRAGRTLAAQVTAGARPAPEPAAAPPRPASPGGPIEVCLASDERPPLERARVRPPEVFSMVLPVGLSMTRVRGVRFAPSPFESRVRAPASPESERLSAQVASSLAKSFPGTRVSPEGCEEEPPSAPSPPRLWLRLDHAYAQQFLKSNTTVSASTRETGSARITEVSASIRAGGTPPLAYWRAAVVYCDGSGCRSGTLAGQNDPDPEPSGAEGAIASPLEDAFREGLSDLAREVTRQVQAWTTPGPTGGGPSSPAAAPRSSPPAR